MKRNITLEVANLFGEVNVPNLPLSPGGRLPLFNFGPAA